MTAIGAFQPRRTIGAHLVLGSAPRLGFDRRPRAAPDHVRTV